MAQPDKDITGKADIVRHFGSVADLVRRGADLLAKGPLAVIIAEDDVEVDSTLRHHLALGFAQVVLFGPPRLEIPDILARQIVRVDHHTADHDAAPAAVNPLIAAANGQWVFYCYNAEYLFYPFSESRSVAELLVFHAEERREAMRGIVLDLYPGDLADHPLGVALEDAWFDRAGYFSLAREDQAWNRLDRQENIYGGLRWRFQQEIPLNRRRIDRVPIFRAQPGLRLLPDHTLSDAEMNTLSCPWHNNLTAAVVSFRSAKALISNISAGAGIETFQCVQSVPFEWRSQQLMDLGFIELGQWF